MPCARAPSTKQELGRRRGPPKIGIRGQRVGDIARQVEQPAPDTPMGDLGTACRQILNDLRGQMASQFPVRKPVSSGKQPTVKMGHARAGTAYLLARWASVPNIAPAP